MLAVAIGDPAGVGPELLVQALQTREPQERMRVMLLGNLDGLQNAARAAGSDLSFLKVSGPAEARTFATARSRCTTTAR